MILLPIKEHIQDNKIFIDHPLCQETLPMTIDFYKKVGFHEPWICYYVQMDHALVGSAAFKGQPIDGTVEIAYGTFPPYQQQGIGTRICRSLVDLALKTDPLVRITARTLPEENFSTRILRKNGFQLAGTVNDPEDGDVWEWVYQNGQIDI
jgi:RimJ/RimL family protein N-acetyltransferase